MTRELINGLHLWQFANLTQESGIAHFVTDRNTAESEFTLSLSSSPDKERVRSNRKRLAEALGLSPAALFFPSQVHGTRIVHVTAETAQTELLETDALITRSAGICIAVMSADCVPILLYDRRNCAIAAIHSGWRGTVARILEKTLHRMEEEFGTQGVDIIAGIGPSVSQEAYEVGEEVVNEVNRAFGAQNDLMIAHAPDKARLDLWKANFQQLTDFGVKPGHIEISDLCTVRNNQHFFSARKGDAGRFAAGIVLH
jgi:polyphenol oxidase